jgi:hypothetical protein
MLLHRAVGNAEIQKWSMIVFFDNTSGEIRHIHQCISLKGAKHKTKQQIERDAKDTLKRRAPALSKSKGMSLLHVDPVAIDWKHQYRVDPKRRVLVKRPARRPPREGGDGRRAPKGASTRRPRQGGATKRR